MTLYCEKHANLAQRNTLFIHGNLASSAWWRPTLDEWTKAGTQGAGALFFADWRGCGHNPEWPQNSPFRLQDLAADFLELMEREHLHECDLVGHSLGGLIALQMMILAPKRFCKTLLLDPVGARGVVFDDSLYEAFRQMAKSSDLTRTAILATVRGAENLDAALVEQLAADAFKAVRGIGTSVLEILKTVDIRENLKTVATPTLILHGAHDGVLPLEDAKALSELIPGARLEILPEAGHCWNIENPKAFTARLSAWLS